MRKFAILIALAALPALLFAQEEPMEREGPVPGVSYGGTQRLTHLIGLDIHSEAGDLQGQIRDMVISPRGDLIYLVISAGGAEAAVGAEAAEGAEAGPAAGSLYLVPRDRLVGADENGLIFDLTTDELQGLETVPEDMVSMPAPEPAVEVEVDEDDATATLADGPSTDLILAGHLIGGPFSNWQGSELGTVEDIVIDLAQGHVEYAAVAPTGVLGASNLYLPVGPQRWVEFDTTGNGLIVAIDEVNLRDEQGFPPNGAWPTSGEATFTQTESGEEGTAEEAPSGSFTPGDETPGTPEDETTDEESPEETTP